MMFSHVFIKMVFFVFQHLSMAKVIPGWNHFASSLRKSSQFWNKIWVEAGCPRNGICTNQPKQIISILWGVQKGDVFTLLVGCLPIYCSSRIKGSFGVKWGVLKWVTHKKQATVIDGLTSDCDISNVFNSKLAAILNVSDMSERQKLFEELKF